jgi:hypothetical protein
MDVIDTVRVTEYVPPDCSTRTIVYINHDI